MVFVLDSNLLALTFLCTVAMQLLFFAIAWTFKFDKVTDVSRCVPENCPRCNVLYRLLTFACFHWSQIAGSMNFVLIAWLTFFINGNYYTRQIVVFVMVNVWGFRLGLFLLYRVLQRGKDDRFNEMREDFLKFLGFWIFQMIW